MERLHAASQRRAMRDETPNLSKREKRNYQGSGRPMQRDRKAIIPNGRSCIRARGRSRNRSRAHDPILLMRGNEAGACYAGVLANRRAID
jgi:hypothetical protein